MADEARELAEVQGLLEEELEAVKQANKRSMIIGGVVLVLIGGYLLFANHQVKKIFDPEGLALAASGVALGAVPEAADALETIVVDGAPDIARTATQSILDMLPTYRMVMEEELDPVVDEVTGILAQATFRQMLRAGEAAKNPAGEQLALQAGADAVVERFDLIVQQGLDEPLEDHGHTPRQAIEASLGQLVTIDRGLKQVVRGKGDPRERELLLAWIDLIGQYHDTANAAAVDQVRAGVPTPE